MRISPKHGFVYISTPKAGTHTIYRILGEHYADGLIEDGFHNTKVPAAFQDLPRWTVVRNPFSRAVSLWWSVCRCHPEDQYGARQGCGSAYDFLQFVEWMGSLPKRARVQEPLFQSQYEWLVPVQPLRAVHLEHLQEGLQKFPWWRPEIVLPQLNTTAAKIRNQSQKEGAQIRRPSWQVMCQDERVQRAVKMWASRDFEEFGYSTQVDL